MVSVSACCVSDAGLSFSLNNMEDLLMVERAAFQNLPEIAKLELCNNPRLSYVDPQAFRCLSVSETCPCSFPDVLF